MIDVTFDFRSDTPKGKDPDKYSPTLKTYHQLLWSKALPNGDVMDLKKGKGLYYLTWKDFDFGSDSIIVELRYQRYKNIIDEVAKTIILLSKTSKKFTVFHSANSHMVQMGDIIYVLNELGFNIEVVSDEEFINSMNYP